MSGEGLLSALQQLLLPCWGQEFPFVDDEPSEGGVREGVGLCDWLTTQHGQRESWDTCSGLLTALPAHGQGLAETVLFLRGLQVTQT